jgi:SNF2 family DNA or RNA helicase
MRFFDYQEEAITFINEVRRTYIAFDMGMGKTITAIGGAHEAATKHILLVAEKNEIVNSQNFRKEVEAHFTDMDYISLRETDIETVRQADSRMVCGINPEALDKIDDEDIEELFDAMAIDEATLAKTTTSQRFKKVRKISKKMEVLIMLSGTPMMNGAAELFAPLTLLEHPLAGDGKAKSQKAFERIFAGGFYKKIRSTEGLTPEQVQKQYWKYYQWWAKGANNVRELRYLMESHFIFRRKQDTNVFKKKERRVEWVEKSAPWIMEYERAWDEYLVSAKKRNMNMTNVTELRRLIENGQVYQVNSRWKARQAVADIAAGKYGDKRIIIFSLFIETDRVIQEELTKAGISWKSFEDLADWKAEGSQVLVGRIKSHAKGGNVPEASVTLMVDMDFVPSMNLQAENRMDRPEQQNEMEVVYYMAKGEGDIDAHVQKINRDKNRKIDEFTRPFTAEELEEMPKRIAELVKENRSDFKTLAEAYGGDVPWGEAMKPAVEVYL